MDFIKAALPWILMGIPVAIIVANLGAIMETQSVEKRTKRSGMGIGLGLLLGLILGSTGFFGELTGMAIGLLWGMAITVLVTK